MALQTTTNINVDFYDKKYIMIDAKQYDDCSRYISITCYDNGKLFNLSSSKHTAYIRYRKADGNGVLNSCRINTKGEVLVELTEQMLYAEGICYVDLVIVNKGSAIINIDTGEIVTIDDSAIISTMAFCINVHEASFDSSVAESSDEYIALNDALKMVNAEYKEVVQLARSYAIGDANNVRENEDFDNSKYYSEIAKSYAIGNSGVRTGENTDNAKYYSEQSSNSASESETAKSASEAAQGLAEKAQAASELAQSLAETAQSKSEEAQNKSETAQGLAETARSLAEEAQGLAEGAKIAAEIAQGKAEDSKNASEIAQGLAEEYQKKAQDAQSAAELAQSLAETAQSLAETAQQNAEQAASNAAQNAVDNVFAIMNDCLTASQESATNAANSEQAAATSEANAKLSEQAAVNSATSAYTSETKAFTSETNASASEANALGYADIAKSYAIGGTDIRENEDVDNAKYYYELVNSIANNIGNIATVDEVKEYLGIE